MDKPFGWQTSSPMNLNFLSDSVISQCDFGEGIADHNLFLLWPVCRIWLPDFLSNWRNSGPKPTGRIGSAQ